MLEKPGAEGDKKINEGEKEKGTEKKKTKKRKRGDSGDHPRPLGRRPPGPNGGSGPDGFSGAGSGGFGMGLEASALGRVH